VSVQPRPPRAPLTLLVLFALLALFVAAPTASAEPPRDASQIAARVRELGKDPGQMKLLAAQLRKVEATLERVRNARVANDSRTAAQLTLLAGEWLEVAELSLRATQAERQRAAVDKKVLELVDTVSRTEILLEETLAARERTREQLERFRAQKRTQPQPGSAR
jgi:hypothetical protein